MKTIYNLAFFLGVIFLSASAISAQSSDSQIKSEKKKVPLKIIKRPSPPSSRGCSEESGRVSIKVTFDKSAKITQADIITPSSCDSFNQNAVRASKEIKFIPEQENDEPITVSKIIQYNFTRY